MQNISKRLYPRKSVVSMLPIIDLDPADMNCIYSTLIFIVPQATSLYINSAVATFNQPLWLKATEIFQTLNLKIVPILGRFHMMMSYAHSIGMLMNGSGLDAALQTSYDPNSVKQVLSGKNITMFLWAKFLTESALVLKIMSLFFDDTSNQTIDHPIIKEPNELVDDHSDEDILNGYVDPDEWKQAVLESNDDFLILSGEEVDKIIKLLYGVEKNYEETLNRLAGSGKFNLLKQLVKNVKHHFKKSSRTSNL